MLLSKNNVIETNRLKIYTVSKEQIEEFIAKQIVLELKKVYTEMLNGCLAYPEKWEW